MPLLDVVQDTEPIMRKTSRKIKYVDDDLRQLVSDMYETMVENWGVGLAAVQVGVLKRLFIYEIPKREVHGYETCRPDESLLEDQEVTDEVADDATGDEPDDEEPDPGYTGEYNVCINPRIISREGSFIDDEGCLSKAGWMAKVERAYQVTFQAYDLEMNRFERTVTGLEARCVLHETDHLDGILFTDRAVPGTLREISDEEIDEEAEEAGEEPIEAQAGASGKSDEKEL